MIDLPSIWFFIICLEIGLYVVLDGADLGIGLLSLFPQKEDERSVLIHTVGPIWDANETWLVIAGGTLFGAFPLAYAIVLNALYIPIYIMIFGFILRAAAFEFRVVSKHKRFWSALFGLGSLLAIVGQGAAAGGLLSGIAITNGHFGGGAFDWATPITLFTTIGIAMSYAVVGYAYLIKKTAHELHAESFVNILGASLITIASFIVLTLLLPAQHYIFLQRWTVEPTRSFLIAVVGLIALFGAILIWGAIRRSLHHELHGLTLAIFVLAFLGLIVGVYPYMIPPILTAQDLAASSSTLTFMLWGLGPLLPIVFAYNVYMYHVFRGTTADDRSEY